MYDISGLNQYKSTKRSAVTLGKFDGLHRGHQKLVEKVRELSEEKDLESIVCAFDMQPLFERLRKPRKVLMTKKERREHLENRVDCLVNCPFTEEFSKIEAKDFIHSVLCGIFHAAFIVVGSDFHFGYEKKGDIHMLADYARQYDYQLIVIEKEKYRERVISSTYVKEALQRGDMQLVETLLGYPYTVSGVVEHGKKLGRTLGFPTLNVEPEAQKMMPPNGVYINRVKVDDAWYNAIGNVGVKPTVSRNSRVLIESFLFDYDGDAYEKAVEIELYKFLRPEQKFADISELKACIDRDIAYGRRFFGLEKKKIV